LQVIGKSNTAACPFCSHPEETLWHWQQDCPQFSDARTKVHDDIWAEVYKAILPHLPAETEAYKETTIGMTDLRFTGLRTTEQEKVRLNGLKPDGIFFNRQKFEWTLVDYTRSSGNARDELNQAEQAKMVTYGPVADAWKDVKKVEVFPLASSYNGALAEDTWRRCMDRLGIDGKKQELILLTAVRAICVGFSSMVDIRYGALNNTHHTFSRPQGHSDQIPQTTNTTP
jgi:hypothetical protein